LIPDDEMNFHTFECFHVFFLDGIRVVSAIPLPLPIYNICESIETNIDDGLILCILFFPANSN
jgi:hypothetical protein